MRAFAIINLGAANDERVRSAVAAARAAGHALHVRVVYEGSQIETFVDEALRAGSERVLIAGGDGSLNAAATALHRAESEAALAPIPFGTANDFATACGVAIEPEDAFRYALSGAPHAIDLGLANGRPFVNVASLGASARATTEVGPVAKRALGGVAYWFKGIAEGMSAEAVDAEVEAEGWRWSGPLLAMTVANCRLAGGGQEVGPDARLDDGLLDVLLAPELSIAERSALAAESLSERWAVTSERVEYRQLSALRVRFPRPVQVNFDGEPDECAEIEFGVAPGALRVVAPDLPLG